MVMNHLEVLRSMNRSRERRRRSFGGRERLKRAGWGNLCTGMKSHQGEED
jgi:hypothetical protein